MNHLHTKWIVLAGVAGLAGIASISRAQVGALILNEYNGVSDTKYLNPNPPDPYPNLAQPWEGADSFFGRVQANGGNWAEFVVTQDHLDIRGWTLEWSNADPDAGSVTFNNNAIWSNLRSGTIITVREDDLSPPGYGVLLSDTSVVPDIGDFWIHVNVDDASLVDQTGFKVDNDDWQLTIRNAASQVVFGPVGEAVAGWGGSGINSGEIGKNQADPSSAVTGADFNDSEYSSFGSPNRYADNTGVQNFDPLRTWWINRTPGDVDLDGDVDLSDLGALATHYGQTSNQHWANGNFDGDGDVDLSDLGALATHYGAGAAQAFADFQSLGISVPEPASAGSTIIMIAIVARSRTRKRTRAANAQ